MVGKRKPAFKPTAAQRKDVSLYKAGGMSDDGIAAALGICRNTLLNHFAAELEAAHQQQMAANLKRMNKAADKGNVSAMKYLDQRFLVTRAAEDWNGKPTAPAAEPQARKGKKEQAAETAETAGQGTGWGSDLDMPGMKPN